MGGVRFQQGEKEAIVEWSRQEYPYKEIIKLCEKTFKTKRTPSSISTLISKASREPNKYSIKPHESKLRIISQREPIPLRQTIYNFDQTILMPALSKREELIYSTLKTQAEYLHSLKKGSQLYDHLKNLSIEEVVAKITELNKSGSLTDILSSTQESSSTKEINIYASKNLNHQEETRLILPVYLKTANNAQTEKADSVLHSASLYVFLKEMSLRKSSKSPFQEENHDLTGYNFMQDIDSLNISKISERITELVQRHYPSFKLDVIKDNKGIAL